MLVVERVEEKLLVGIHCPFLLYSKSQVNEIGEYYNNIRVAFWKYILNKKDTYKSKLYLAEVDIKRLEVKKIVNGLNLVMNFGTKSFIMVNIIVEKKSAFGIPILRRMGDLIIDINVRLYHNLGGGFYNDKILSDEFLRYIKFGRWIELKTFKSFLWENTKNDNKIGTWDIYQREKGYKKNFKLIGGGKYDSEGSQKIGQWIEISDGFWSKIVVTSEGQNSKKVGRWNFSFVNWDNDKPIEVMKLLIEKQNRSGGQNEQIERAYSNISQIKT
ncbi:unnamed protein product [Paramecium pentaurelia]|uniref:Uncharacterized protein n=1 Tax=Paramecium pentaurelia TaxID=43138 RepID=A0A8S1TZJ2_9CILI|nr:unnamed protein product [Paramecium pentaurelia]